MVMWIIYIYIYMSGLSYEMDTATGWRVLISTVMIKRMALESVPWSI